MTVDQVGGRRRWVLGRYDRSIDDARSAPVVGGFSLSTEQDVDPGLRHLSRAADQGRRARRCRRPGDVDVDGRLVSSGRGDDPDDLR